MNFSFLEDKRAKLLFDLFTKKGESLYAVGGIVRNEIAGFHIDHMDMDFSTGALPDKVEAILRAEGLDYSDRGKTFGTIKTNIGGVDIDITTMRQDDYGRTRYPKVQYTKSVEKDSKRRDFTMNAIYVNRNGKIFDFHSGVADIEKKVVKFITDPKTSIRKDPLRLVRYLRFCSQYFWKEIDENTFQACVFNFEQVFTLPKSKFNIEWDKFLAGKGAERILAKLGEYQLVEKINRYLAIHSEIIKDPRILYMPRPERKRKLWQIIIGYFQTIKKVIMENTKCGFVALIGATNSGKSTLLNTIMAEKISITSHKVQTTRNQVRGIKTVGNVQMVFVDTPGIFNPKGKFDKAMVSSAWSAMNDSECIIYLIDAVKGITPTFENIVKKLQTVNTPIALCLNKVDAIEKDKLLKLTNDIITKSNNLFKEVFMISAINGDGVDEVLNWIEKQMPEFPFFFDSKTKTDIPLEFQLAEITREKIYQLLHQELPYSIAVKTESIEKGTKAVTVKQTIYTAQENHKSIIIGAKGSKLKTIGVKAREEMEALFACKVNLFIFVKVKENWRENPDFFNDIGLEFKK